MVVVGAVVVAVGGVGAVAVVAAGIMEVTQ